MFTDMEWISYKNQVLKSFRYIADTINSLFFKKGCLTCNLDRFEIFAIYEPYPQFYHQ
jgi:hypothetical protein